MENLSQDNVRDRLIKYVKDNGSKYYHISHSVGIPHYIMSRWKNKHINLWQSSLENVDKYLVEKGY